MPARLPLQAKTPFQLHPEPLLEMSSPRAGLLAASRTLRSLRVPVLADVNLGLKARRRGFREGQSVEAVLLLQIAGGDCPEDMVRIPINSDTYSKNIRTVFRDIRTVVGA